MYLFSKKFYIATHRHLLVGLLALVCSISSLSQAQTARDRIGKKKSTAITESSDEIDTTLGDVSNDRKTVFRNGILEEPLEAWGDFWHIFDEKTGISMAFAYTTLYQVATNGHYTGPRSGGSGDFDMVGRWSLINTDSHDGWINEGTLGFATEYRHKIGAATPADLGDSLGSLWGTTAGFNEEDFTLKEIWWHQNLFDDRLAFRLGRLKLDNIFDAYRFTGANHFYTNKAFSRNPTIPFPNTNLGLVFSWRLRQDLFVIIGGGRSDGRESETTNVQEQAEEWFTATTFGWKPKHKFGTGLYQVTLWHADNRSNSNLPSATGYSILLQQELSNGWTPFLRYAHSDNRVTDTKKIFTGGVVQEGTKKRPNDRIGLAVAWGQPHSSRHTEQWTAELFYRYSVIPTFRITPSAQIIFNPSKNSRDQAIGVFGIRGRITF